MRNSIFALFIMLAQTLFAQDTLHLMSGKIKYIQADSMDYDYLYYHKIKKNGEVGRKKRKNLDFIFSINYKNEDRKYIYQKDTMLDNFFSVGQMEYYLEGKRQAAKNFKPYITFAKGVVVGTGVAMYSLFPIVYDETDRFVEVLDTVTNSVVTVRYVDPKALSIPIPYWEIIPLGAFIYFEGNAKNTKRFKADDDTLFKNEAFMTGYKEKVVDKKVIAAFGSSVGSYLATIFSYLLFDPVSE